MGDSERETLVLNTVTSLGENVCVVVCVCKDNVAAEAFRRERERDLHVNKGFNGAVNR